MNPEPQIITCARCLSLYAAVDELRQRVHGLLEANNAETERRRSIAAERDSMEVELAEVRKTYRIVNEACGDALDRLWKDIIFSRKPDYGDWEYPGYAYRHLKAEFDQANEKRLQYEDLLTAARAVAAESWSTAGLTEAAHNARIDLIERLRAAVEKCNPPQAHT